MRIRSFLSAGVCMALAFVLSCSKSEFTGSNSQKSPARRSGANGPEVKVGDDKAGNQGGESGTADATGGRDGQNSSGADSNSNSNSDANSGSKSDSANQTISGQGGDEKKLSDSGDGSDLADKSDNKVARQSADGTLEVSDSSLTPGNGCKRVNKRWEGPVKINLNENTTDTAPNSVKSHDTCRENAPGKVIFNSVNCLESPWSCKKTSDHGGCGEPGRPCFTCQCKECSGDVLECPDSH